MTTAALEPAGGLHEAWSFEARQALAYSVGGLGPECCMDLVHIIFGSSHKVDVVVCETRVHVEGIATGLAGPSGQVFFLRRVGSTLVSAFDVVLAVR